MPPQIAEFDGLAIAYDADVLEPRGWTVEQSRWAAALLDDLPPGPVLELCAGAGQIGLATAARSGRALVQVDVDARACALARRNAMTAGIEADVRHAHLDDAVAQGERFPLVLADPPYISSDEVGDHHGDPGLAVDGGEDGLDLVRTCLRVAAGALEPGGAVLLQLGGPAQSTQVTAEAGGVGLAVVEARTFGPDRSVVLLRPAG